MRGRLLGAALAGALVLVAATPVAAQSLEEVLSRHYEAIGGLESWASTETVSLSGNISLLNGMMQGPFTIVQQRPTKSHMTFTVQGQEIVQAYDGETAWMVVPPMGMTEPTEADPATAAAIVDQADFDGPLIGWEEDGHELELVGPETLDGTEVIKLTVRLSHGTVSHYYLDPETYLPVRIESTTAGQQSTVHPSDYREVGGLIFPFTLEIDTPQGLNVLTFDEVEVNVPVDESLFSMNGG